MTALSALRPANKPVKFRHILSGSQFSRKEIDALFARAQVLEEFWVKHRLNPQSVDYEDFLKQYGVRARRLANIFYQPSTRTRASFRAAWKFLRGDMIFETENAAVFSSAAKGETLKDTIRIIQGLGADVIVLRHPQSGAAKDAVELLEGDCARLINAGDGTGEHPTQALLDYYTLRRCLGQGESIRIAFMGDIAHSRTIRSLALMLKDHDARMYFCAPQLCQLPDELAATLRESNVEFHVLTHGWQDLIQNRVIHALYQTRIQTEYFDQNDPEEAKILEEIKRLQPLYTITEEIGTLMDKKQVYLMHPLPRVDEIHEAVDRFTTSIYFQQAQNGLFVRMALMSMMF